MAKALEIEITARETIKPSSPTPHHLRNFKLSLLDQIVPVEYGEEVLFYTRNGDNIDDHAKVAQISQRLKTSLSQVLTRFYPFAGIIKDSSSVECNDNGAEFVQAHAKCCLSDILQQPDQKLLRELVPIEVESPNSGSGPLLLTQVTFFKCGGMAIAICLSHKMADGWTMCTFINSWAKTALESRNAVLPEFVAASRFPPDKSLPLMPFAEEIIHFHYVTKRFVFYASKIAELKTKVASASVPKPTRAEAVISLIWKCTIAASRSIRGFPRLSLTAHFINLRNLVSPPLSENCMGNFLGNFAAQTNEREINLHHLIYQLRKGKEEFSKNGIETILENKTILPKPELESQIDGDEIDFYVYSNIIRFPFYEADFGWGKPIWVSIPNFTYNVIMLRGTRDGEEIEALVSLREADMAVFERDQELLEFAAFNPSVLSEANGSAKLLSHL